MTDQSRLPGSTSEPVDPAREIATLRVENARLRRLLDLHGIRDPATSQPDVTAPFPSVQSGGGLSATDKISLFRRLFHGRTDTYAVRWENRAGRSGYAPACANEWRPGVCEKPRIKCGDCLHRSPLPLTDQVVFEHLTGKLTIGIYPLLADDRCHLLAVDFDGDGWRDDVRAFSDACDDLGVPVALEISRSGNGAHAWIFFAQEVPARDARRLGTAVISHACATTRQLALSTYDRLFPNQDTMPKGGFGNLIALPLQYQPRERGCSVFVDRSLRPYTDQWGYLGTVRTVPPDAVEGIVRRATGERTALDVAFVVDEGLADPWKRPPPKFQLAGPLPASVDVTLADRLYIAKDGVPQPLENRMIRLAAFQNPDFYRAQAMGFSTWNKPRVFGRAENFPRHIALPRGCLDDLETLLRDNSIALRLRDERQSGTPLTTRFSAALRPEQQRAVTEMLEHESGVLCAPTAFGKTVVAAALIAARGVNALVLVHRTELLRQWQARLRTFLELSDGAIGSCGNGKNRMSGLVDVAVMQSVSRGDAWEDRIGAYGHVIVDECHHLSATSFESLMARVRARYILGLTATPIRRDGQQPIIFMQCGPIRHRAVSSSEDTSELRVEPVWLDTPIRYDDDTGIQEVFRQLAGHPDRNAAIAATVAEAFTSGRKVIVLTERTSHLMELQGLLASRVKELFVLHGRMSRRRRADALAELEGLPKNAPRVLLATGRLIGEGFDHAPLDTLVLAMPISWSGTLQQYAGRLHRDRASKPEIVILDFVDSTHPALLRMWRRRQRGYRTMGYRIDDRAEREREPDRAESRLPGV